MSKHLRLKRTKYLIPSLFTTCAMFFSFYALLLTVAHDFSWAAYSVIAAMVFDSLDGRTARMTNTSTKFGASYDSITDMMAYGVAPAIMLYGWGLLRLGKLGFLVCFIFCACAGLRLARFNVTLQVLDKKYFQGLSSTIAGGVMVSYILACEQSNTHSLRCITAGAMLAILCSFLMVSNIRFYSFKEIKLSTLKLLALLVSGGILISAILIYRGLAIFVVLLSYVGINLLIDLARLLGTKVLQR